MAYVINGSTFPKYLVSVHHQLGAYHTANQIYQVYQSSRPVYHHARLFQINTVQDQVTVRSQNNLQLRINFNLSTCRSSFFYQGAKLWSALPMYVKTSRNSEQFKSRCKNWIGRNIKVKPLKLNFSLLETPVNNSYANWLFLMEINK